MVFQYRIYNPETGELIPEQVRKLAKTIKQIQVNLDPELTAHGRKFMTKTDCKIGLNCKKLLGIEIYNDEDSMVAEITNTYNNSLNKTNKQPTVIDIEEVEDFEEETETGE